MFLLRLANVALVITLSWLAMSEIGRADPKSFGTGVEIRRYSESKLGPVGAKLWSTLNTKNQYFGALSYNAAVDAGDVYYNIASLQDAITIANASCADSTRGKAGKCVLYALALPKGFPKKTFKAEGLSRGMLDNFKTGFLRNHVRGRFSAYAMTRLGNDGWAWDYAAAAEARDAAILSCQSGVLRTLAGLPKSDGVVAKRQGMMDCKVVAQRGP